MEGPVGAERATPVVMSAEELIALHMHHYSKPATNGIHRIFCEMREGVLEDICEVTLPSLDLR